ncbi:MAG: tetratricopeptide repeat protein [bacterium]
MNGTPRKKPPARAVTLFFLLILSCFAFFLPAGGDNVNTRLDLAAALVNDGGTRIDRYHSNTIDKAKSGGHFYTDKAPGTSLWALAPASARRRGRGVNPDDASFRRAATFLVVTLPSAAAAAALLCFIFSLTGSLRLSIAVSSFYSLGTLVFPYSTMFYSHALTAAMSLSAFLVLFSAKRAGREPPAPALLTSGALCGAMTITEFPSAATAALLFVYAFFAVRRKARLVLFAAGALPFAAAAILYNQISFGAPFALGYLMEATPELRAGMSRGFAGLTIPGAQTFHRLLSFPGRGLLWESPFLLFALPGWWFMFRNPRFRPEALLSLSVVLGVFITGAAAFMPEGGMAPGPRYLIPALPFMCVPMAFIPWRGAWQKGAFLGVGAASAAMMWLVTAAEPHVPRGFDFPVFDFAVPLLLEGYARASVLDFAFSKYSYAVLFAWLAAVAANLVAALPAGVPRQEKKSPPAAITAAAALSALVFFSAFVALSAAGSGENRGIKYCRRGTFFRQSGMTRAAAKHYLKGIGTGEEVWECHFGLGMIHHNDGRYADAVGHYRRALEIRPVFPEGRMNLGSVLAALGQPARALEEYRLAFDAAYSQGTFQARDWLRLSRALAALGDERRAGEARRMALELDPFVGE